MSQAIEVGTVLADTYEVTRLLGKGGMGSVWEAKHLRLQGKRVAVKVLLPEVAADADAVVRFHREAHIASRLGHPNIVQVHDINQLPDGTSYLVMEYLEGESLAERLARGPIPVPETLAVIRQVGSALAAAHAAGIIHRDLKPHNIFLCPTEAAGYATEQAKVLDFGISKMRGSSTVKTQTTTMLGTPQYMAPEQATGNHASVDARTDVFALGVILYEMLSGTEPFKGNSIPEVVFKVVYEHPPDLSGLVPGLDPEIVAAVQRAMAKGQDERFADVSELVEALTGDPLTTLRGAASVSPIQDKPLPPSVNTPMHTKLPARNPEAYAATATPGGMPAVPNSAFDALASADTVMPNTALPAVTPAGPGGSHGPGVAAAHAATMLAGAGGPSAVHAAATMAPPPAAGPAAETPQVPGTDSGKPQGQRKGLLIGLGVVVVAIAAGGSYGLVKKFSNEQPIAQETPESPTTTPDTASGDGPQAGQNGTAALSGGQSGDTATPVEPPDSTVEANGAGNDQRNDQTSGQTGDQTSGTKPPDSGKSEKPESGKNGKNGGKSPPALSGELGEKLKEAERLFKKGKYDAAIRLARRIVGKKKTPLAYAIMVKSYCKKRDLNGARAAFRNISRRRTKKKLASYCEKYDIYLE